MALETVLQYAQKIAALQTYRDLGDRDLLQKFVTGKDEGAFAALVERHGPLVLGVCRRALRNEHDAEDASQATFLVLARRSATIRKTTALSSWLYGVAARIAANVRRERARRDRRERQTPEPDPCDPVAELSWREVQSALDEELLRLPENVRAPLVLCYLDGRTRDEAAGLLGLGVGCLHGRLERGRKILGDRLTRRGLTLSAALAAAALATGATQAFPAPAAVVTTRAALRFARGETPAGLVSDHVLSLTRGALKHMPLTVLKPVATVMLCAGLLLAAVGGAFAPAGPPQATKSAPEQSAPKGGTPADDAKALQGEWQVVELEADGKKDTSEGVTHVRLTFRGDEITLRSTLDEGVMRKIKFKLDPSAKPRQIDLLSLDGPEKGKTTPGIYSLEKGRLRIGYGRVDGKRPADFKTRPEDDRLVLILERAGKKQPGQPISRRPSETAIREWMAIDRAWRKIDNDFWQDYQKAKTPDQWRRLQTAKQEKNERLSERCLKFAATFPDHKCSPAALWWAAGLAPQSATGMKAWDLFRGRIANTDLEELFQAVAAYGPGSERGKELAPEVLARVKQNLDHRRAAKLLGWVCSRSYRSAATDEPPPFAEAARLIVTRFEDSPDIHWFCETLAPPAGVPPAWAAKYEKDLRTLLEKNRHRLVRVTARFALASVLKSKGEAHHDEAAREFEKLLKDFDGSDPRIAGVENEYLRVARAELDEVRFRAVGKTALKIDGVDLDGRPMKLSEHRGKVVLLSFWAIWCFPCVKFIPHERALVARMEGKPFVLVGVNSDNEADVLKEALKTHQINWRSFRDRRAGKAAISDDWKILGYPTLFLIDHQGVIRHRWIGAPPAEELNRAVDRLVEAVGKK
jgi:RNA polymerase sigma factor (sigma-70 family)